MNDPEVEKILRQEEIQDKIEAFMDAEIRPFVQEDGGDVDLLSFDLETGIVRVAMRGACSTCPSSIMTLQFGIERRLLEAFPEIKGLKAVGGLDIPGFEPEN